MKLFRTKSFTSTTAAAILIAGMSFANAQNAAGPARAGASPSDLNAAVKGTGIHQSGSETKGAAMKKKETKPMNAAQRTTVAPNDPNAKPIGSGSATQSGSQSEKSAMSGSNTKASVTTGYNTKKTIDPSSPNYEPPHIKAK